MHADLCCDVPCATAVDKPESTPKNIAAAVNIALAGIADFIVSPKVNRIRYL